MLSRHVYSGNPLNRGERERRDEKWLEDQAADSKTRILLLKDLKVLVSGRTSLSLAWHSPRSLSQLGMDGPHIFLGLLGGRTYFTTDLSHLDTVDLEQGSCRFEDVRAIAGELSRPDAGIVAHARAQIHWHARNRYCPVCGAITTMARGGQVRKCPGCRAEHFPRTDPVIITVVEAADRCLLGQSLGRQASSKMFSTLAGFVDQGESIEEAVAREVMEEAGIRVRDVRYHSSQPWPFPSSLMIGCHAHAMTKRIVKDDAEMMDVRWFSRDEVLQALDGKSPTLVLPGSFAIAHHLIKAWAHRDF